MKAVIFVALFPGQPILRFALAIIHRSRAVKNGEGLGIFSRLMMSGEHRRADQP